MADAAAVLLGAVLVPLTVTLAALFARGRALPLLHAGALGANGLAAAAVAMQVSQHGPLRYALGGWGAPLGIDLAADGLAAAMLLLTAVVAGIGAVHARAARETTPLFWPLYYALWASLNALFLSADVFNLYVTLELVTLAAVALVAQSGERAALHAAMRYLLVALFGSILYLAGVAFLYGAAGVLDIALLSERVEPGFATWTAAVLMTAGLAVKTALFPFHVWLPPAHARAASPVSAVLSGLVVKASFFLLVRLWFGPFAGLESDALLLALGALGGGALVWGSLAAWRQNRLKLMVAYSTVAQIGYLFLLFPLATAAPSAAWNGAFVHALAHGTAKAAMFLAAGNVLWALKSDDIRMLTHLGGRLRMTLMAMALAGVSLIGLPPAGGFVGKWLLLEAAIVQGAWVFAILLVVGSLLAALYIFRVLAAALSKPTAGETVHVRPVPRTMELAALALAVVAFGIGIGAALPLGLIEIGVPFAQAAEPRVDTFGGGLLLAILLSSFFPGLAVFFLSESQSHWRTALNLTGAVLKVGLVAVLLAGVNAGYTFEARLAFLPGLDLVLRADPLTLQFLTLSAGLWLVTTVYAIGYLKTHADRSRFFGFFNLSVTASTGIALSGNLLTFLYFYEFLTLATYPLVVHHGSREARAAGRTYLAYTLAGGAAVLLGTAWLHAIGGTLEFSAANSLATLNTEAPVAVGLIFALLIGGMGVKAALVPLHGWLPRAMVAPAPVSALLHAVAVVKAGAFGIIRVLFDVFGMTFSHGYAGTAVLAAVAAFTIVYGSLRALQQDELKARLAYSTVSQLAYIALGACIASPIAVIGALVHIVHQGAMKITLFFCAGILAEVRGIHKVSEMAGIGWRMPWTMGTFTAAALGMIGLPPLAGFVSKWYLAGGGLQAGATWVVPVLVASSVLNAAYFLPIIHAAWFKKPDRARHRKRPATWWLIAPPLVTAGVALGAGAFAGFGLSPLGWAETIVERTYYGSAPKP